ncbi:hypothetical protein H5410_002122 [Solanum commersonii]|uniref:Uncharacterized protein n=1 Tax=Solanum commersonii TaxID=4109 RepID=A0A9J6B0S4_SOLCO|nr:hypothetical protein H5410_002122 [Solanum commersonii]
MKPFGSSSLQNPLKHRICAAVNHSMSLVEITDQLSDSPFCVIYHRALGHWAIWYCFAKLLRDAPTAPFFRQLDPFLHATHQVNSTILRPLFLRSFQDFCSFVQRSVHDFLETSNTLNLRVFIRY